VTAAQGRRLAAPVARPYAPARAARPALPCLPRAVALPVGNGAGRGQRLRHSTMFFKVLTRFTVAKGRFLGYLFVIKAFCVKLRLICNNGCRDVALAVLAFFPRAKGLP
jgi:hypothetical protein